MAITEESRFQLHQRLNDVLGEEHATTLMEHLPPIGWADVATKRDLDQLSVLLRQEMQSEFALVRSEMRTEATWVRGEFATTNERLEKLIQQEAKGLHRDLNRMTAFIVGTVTVLSGLLGAINYLVG